MAGDEWYKTVTKNGDAWVTTKEREETREGEPDTNVTLIPSALKIN